MAANLEKEKNIIMMVKFIMMEKYSYNKKNGKGKEYNDDGELIFEGEFLNGLRNGKGKEYNDNGNGELIFEGEFFNDFRWNGKGKEYYDNDKLSFEGIYLNGKKKWKSKRIL